MRHAKKSMKKPCKDGGIPWLWGEFNNRRTFKNTARVWAAATSEKQPRNNNTHKAKPKGNKQHCELRWIASPQRRDGNNDVLTLTKL
jgi:hypothetical protein